MIDLKRATIRDVSELIKIEQSVAGSKLYSPMLTEGEWLEELKKSTVVLQYCLNFNIRELGEKQEHGRHDNQWGRRSLPIDFQGSICFFAHASNSSVVHETSNSASR